MRTSFEFVVNGPPVPVDTKGKGKAQTKKHKDWQEAVGRAAQEQRRREGRPSIERPWQVPLDVEITTFYTAARKDVDNIVKPILDGMKNVIYEDDGDIYSLLTRRVDLTVPTKIEFSSTLLVEAMNELLQLHRRAEE